MPPAIDDSVRVNGLRIIAASRGAETQARRSLGLSLPGWLNASKLNEAVDRVYSTGLFETVTYRLDATDSGTVAVVTASTTEPDKIGFGVRYDDRSNVAMLLSADVGNWLGYGSTTRLDLRLGDQLRIGLQRLRPAAFHTPLTVGVSASYTNTPIASPTATGGTADSIDALRAHVINGTVLTGIPVGADGVVGIQLKVEHANGEQLAGMPTIPRAPTFESLSAIARYDSFDRAMFPTSGSSASLQWSGANISRSRS